MLCSVLICQGHVDCIVLLSFGGQYFLCASSEVTGVSHEGEAPRWL